MVLVNEERYRDKHVVMAVVKLEARQLLWNL